MNDEDDLDLSALDLDGEEQFAPEPIADDLLVPVEVVDKASAKARYPTSDEANSRSTAKKTYLRTGPARSRYTEKISANSEPEIAELWRQISKRENWQLGETLRHAMLALERELDGD